MSVLYLSGGWSGNGFMSINAHPVEPYSWRPTPSPLIRPETTYDLYPDIPDPMAPVRQAIADAAMPKIATPPVLSPWQWEVAYEVSWRNLQVPTTEEIAQAMRIEIPLPEMPEPPTYPSYRPSYPTAPTWARRRTSRERLEADRLENLIVVRQREQRRPDLWLRSFWESFRVQQRSYIDRYVEQYIAGIFGVPANLVQGDFNDRARPSAGTHDSDSAIDLGDGPIRFADLRVERRDMEDQPSLYALLVAAIATGPCTCIFCRLGMTEAQPEQTEEERIEAAGQRYQERSAQDFLDYSGAELDSMGYRWTPDMPEEEEDIEDHILRVLKEENFSDEG